METQTRLSRHNKFISAENIVGIFSVSSDDSFYMLCIVPDFKNKKHKVEIQLQSYKFFRSQAWAEGVNMLYVRTIKKQEWN